MFKTVTFSRMASIFYFQVLLFLAVSPVAPAALSQAPQGDRVAVVNGVEIYEAEFQAALQQAMHQLPEAEENMTVDRRRVLRKAVIENLIGRRLAYQESLRLGIRVDFALVDSEMKRVFARIATPDKLAEVLEKSHLSRAGLRAQFKRDIAIRRLFEEQVVRNIDVDDQEARGFYDNNPNLFKTPALVKASHIFIAAGPGSTREERKEAVQLVRAIQERLDQGAEFSEMAIDYSQCASRENGGDLGYFEKEKMIKGFAEAAFALNPGETSDIVRTGRGYHLVRVEDRKPKMKLSFEDAKEKLLRSLKIEKSTQAIKAYLKTLRDSAEVEIFVRL